MAVYTEVNDDELAAFLRGYDVGELVSYKGIAEGVENSNFLVDTTVGRYILTLYERRVNPDDLPFFLSLMDHLAASGVKCPTPVRDRELKYLNILSNKNAALITFLDGVSPRRPTAIHCRGVGQALAKLHLAGADFPGQRPNALSLKGWQALFKDVRDRADSILPGMEQLIGSELATLEKIWPTGLPTGVIHADLFPDNVFFIGDELTGLIDFYFACTDAYAYDIAVCLNAWCFEADFSFNATKGDAFLRGYQSVRKLDLDECTALPTLARGAALRFLLTRTYDWLHTREDALVARKDPFDYVRRLRFHQSATSIASYGGQVIA